MKYRNAMTILDFLFKHAKNEYTPEKWAELIGFQIIDADGWNRQDFKAPCTLQYFVERVAHSTIGPEYEEARQFVEAVEPFPLDAIGIADY